MRLAPGERDKCSICGGDAVAKWVGETDVNVCRHCAVNILPRLIADATVDGERSEYGEILEIFESLKAPFLAAALCQVTIHGRDKKGRGE